MRIHSRRPRFPGDELEHQLAASSFEELIAADMEADVLRQPGLQMESEVTLRRAIGTRRQSEAWRL